MNTTSPGGKIITFYSYKGGTGRSMALANVAWILAANRKRVLILDWDLEAPGLHRYFRPFLIDKQLTASEGLIDFVIDFADEAIAPADSDSPPPPDWYFPYADITRHALSINVGDFFPKPGAIDLIPAGRQGATYATRVNSFNWQNFYDRLGGGTFFEKAKSFMREKYDYILVDSRTGVSDTAGICTVQMPDALVVCFTYNNQSIEGAAAVARSARDGRRQLSGADGSAPFDIFPIPTRVDQSEIDRLDVRRRYARQHFDDLLGSEINRETYWPGVEIPYVPIYSYEETLAYIVDKLNDPKSLLDAVVRITQHLTPKDETVDYKLLLSNEEKNRLKVEFAATPGSEGKAEAPATAITESPSEEKVMQAERAFQRLESAQQAEARRVLTRLVRVARRGEGEHARQRVRLGELSQDHTLVTFLVGAGLLTATPDSVNSEPTFELADDALVRQWSLMRGWIEQDLDFLLWRQRLRDQIVDWKASNFKSGLLLRSEPLREARKMLGEHGADLNDAEKEFITRSSQTEQTEYVAPTQQATVGGPARRAFIIRPFGRKRGASGDEIDFDHVELRLVAPALERLGVEGRTTINIVESGNIRADMFRRLLAADLIVADLSINNANVFYELGIRHALRARSTFLMRCQGDGLSFDLQTERHFEYRRDDPAASLEAMVTALRQTFESSGNQDSPVFLSLPNLPEPDASSLITVPADFRDEVQAAAVHKRRGDLALLSYEVRGFEWETEGWHLVGREQFNLKAFHDARMTWESVRRSVPQDVEANLLLGTIYQRLGDLVRSSKSLERALANKDIEPIKRAEAYSLLARNSKTRWRQTWSDAPPEERREQALSSAFLQDSIEAYTGAFAEDLNHFWSGLNALALLTVRNELAAMMPDVWADRFRDDGEAERELKTSQEATRVLAVAVDRRRRACWPWRSSSRYRRRGVACNARARWTCGPR